MTEKLITHFAKDLLAACDAQPEGTLSVTFRIRDITCENCRINPYGVKVGQIWADNDKRAVGRYLRIVEVDMVAGKARAVNCNSVGGATWGGRKPGPLLLRRFAPTHTGYRLVKDVTQ
jgi:hypothetical protein